jgi:hypothetical protein
MRMKSLTKYLGAVALFAAVTVHAQTPAPSAGESAPPAPAAAKLSIPQMTERSVVFEGQIAEDVQKMNQLRDVARKEKDVVKLTCVNDRLVELKAQQNIYDQSKQQFAAQTSAGNADAARPSYDELSATAEQIKLLRGAAEACIGVPELYKQESDDSVTHPDFPDDPTTTDPFDDPVFETVEPPGYASPFL